MKKVEVGIYVNAEPQRIGATIDSLRTNTASTVDLLILADGPDTATSRALTYWGQIAQSATAKARGAAACFNRLISSTSADVYILLESGSIVAPGWLDYILAALDADSQNGLAGPSTNRSWNEQCLFPHAGNSPDRIAHAASEAARRFGSAWRSLEPLYSLADFCYAVRREVIESIGAADEAYGTGPCWEMDYNIRAARAGWRGVWACGAYVHRAPLTALRVQAERLLFETNKHLYQNKFCGLRLNGAKKGYESHCKGDDCEYFAPAAQIQISLPLEQTTTPKQTTVRTGYSRPPQTRPLVTCIMPTRNRLDYLLQSIRYFQRQDYLEKELIIVDDSVSDISKELPHEANIRVLHSSQFMSIGAKRNWACEVAHGQIIAQWDDDDYYDANRLSHQITPLLSGKADIDGLVTDLIFDLSPWKFWRLSPALHRRIFFRDVHGGTLVYWRSLWQKAGKYPDRSIAEDALFLSKCLQQGARLSRLENQNNFMYVRHSTNSWAFECGKFIDSMGWQAASEPVLSPEDREFYKAHSSTKQSVFQENPLPLVSAIMPTADRRSFVPRAIEYFRRQTYPNKELIIVDDGADPIGDLIPQRENIIYLRPPSRLSVGAKRNLACEKAHGEIILHWDDDDWHAPHRISYQVDALLNSGTDVCGINNMFFLNQSDGRTWQYSYPTNQRFWLSGSTLCYRKSFWAKHRFPEVNVGEDARFIWAGSRARMTLLSDSTFHVGIIHKGNVSPKQTRGVYWKPCPADTIRGILKEDWSFYQ